MKTKQDRTVTESDATVTESDAVLVQLTHVDILHFFFCLQCTRDGMIETIQQCKCPTEYQGLSCQVSYWIKDGMTLVPKPKTVTSD